MKRFIVSVVIVGRPPEEKAILDHKVVADNDQTDWNSHADLLRDQAKAMADWLEKNASQVFRSQLAIALYHGEAPGPNLDEEE